jgi:HK97 gp10 family phage protein
MSVHSDFSKLHQIQRELPNKIAAELNSAAHSMEVLAKALAPVDTGYMREHVSQTKMAAEGDLTARVESEADYSLYVEYGTVNMSSQPFFTPAFESAKRQLGKVRI